MKINARFLNGVFISTGLLAMVVLFYIPGYSTPADNATLSNDVVAYVYPNPVVETNAVMLRIETPATAPLTAQIFDLSGHLLSSHQIKKEHRVASPNTTQLSYELALETDQFKSGTYFGVVSNDDVQHNFRFTVVK